MSETTNAAEGRVRVVAGTLRGRALEAPAGSTTRPSTDRLRESLFNVLVHGAVSDGDPVRGARVLDLFAGSGALGIEALSRGAAHCIFVEEDASARAAIRGNCEMFGLNGVTKIFRRDATALGPLERMEPFSLVFLDPPYGQGLGEAALASLRGGGWLAPGALCVLEEKADVAVAPVEGFTLLDRRKVGLGAVHFLRAT